MTSNLLIRFFSTGKYLQITTEVILIIFGEKRENEKAQLALAHRKIQANKWLKLKRLHSSHSFYVSCLLVYFTGICSNSKCQETKLLSFRCGKNFGGTGGRGGEKWGIYFWFWIMHHVRVNNVIVNILHLFCYISPFSQGYITLEFDITLGVESTLNLLFV